MTDSGGADNERPRAKRPRVALACQRCKTRKQKCDGEHPSCGNCLSYSVECVYVPPENKQASRDQYLRGLEQRVLELENALSKADTSDASNGANNWQVLDYQVQELESKSLENERRPSTSWAQNSVSSVPPVLTEQPAGCPTHTSLHPGQPDDETTSVTEILRELSLEASGRYIGASSNITMGKIIGSLVRRKDSVMLDLRADNEDEPSPRSLYQPLVSNPLGTEDQARLMQDPICDKLLLAYLKHMSLRWPLLRTSFIRALHQRRETLTVPYELAVLHLIYAIGGRFLETTGQLGAFSSEDHHAAAMRNLDDVLGLANIRTVEVLLLLSLHSLRAPKGPGAWSYVGQAMRLCIELGLHRRTKVRGLPKVQDLTLASLEMRKRVFWTAYCVDRQVSIILGRPFAISDRDIDAELPLDVNEDMEDETALATHLTAADVRGVLGQPNQKPTSMSCFIHICRLRIIESNIQQSIYRVDDPSMVSEIEVNRYIEQLEHWRAAMPRHDDCILKPHGSDLEVSLEDYDTEIRPYLCCQRIHNGVCESQTVYYYKCMRFLLHPQLLSSSTNPRFLLKCVEACGGVCQTYKRLHERVSVGFSLMALHSVFLAGLTLIYCTWLSPKPLFGIKISNDMNACSIVLYIITERWPAAKRYRDVFESIKQIVLDSIEQNDYADRKAITHLKPNLQTTMGNWQDVPEGPPDFEAMIADMAGESCWNGQTMTDAQNFDTEAALSFVTGMNASTMTFPDMQLGLSTGLSPDAFSNQWMLNLDGERGMQAPGDFM